MKKKEPSELFDTYEHASPAVREALETQEHLKKLVIKNFPPQEKKRLVNLLEEKQWDFVGHGELCVDELARFIITEIERAKAERDEEIRDWVEIRARADHMDASGKIHGHGSDYCKGWGQCSTDLIDFLSTPQEGDNKK